MYACLVAVVGEVIDLKGSKALGKDSAANIHSPSF